MAFQVQSNRPLMNFTDTNKMSPSLVELRIDYHLNRIMKGYRLNNFANAIKALPLQSRICEKLIEILVRTAICSYLSIRLCSLILISFSADLFGEYD